MTINTEWFPLSDIIVHIPISRVHTCHGKPGKHIFVMECHGNVLEFYFSGKVMEMSWNFTKMSWKKYVFTNSIIRQKNYIFFLQF